MTFASTEAKGTWNNKMLRVNNRDIYTIHGRWDILSPWVENENFKSFQEWWEESNYGDGDFY